MLPRMTRCWICGTGGKLDTLQIEVRTSYRLLPYWTWFFFFRVEAESGPCRPLGSTMILMMIDDDDGVELVNFQELRPLPLG